MSFLFIGASIPGAKAVHRLNYLGEVISFTLP